MYFLTCFKDFLNVFKESFFAFFTDNYYYYYNFFKLRRIICALLLGNRKNIGQRARVKGNEHLFRYPAYLEGNLFCCVRAHAYLRALMMRNCAQ